MKLDRVTGIQQEDPMSWVKLTRAMGGDKLTWTLGAFKQAGIRCRINGGDLEPWLEVKNRDTKHGRLVTLAVDSLCDDDPMFTNEPRAWWFHSTRRLGECLGGIGLLASRFRRNLADSVQCVSDGASPYDCPYATGLIAACPVDLYDACRPMVRLECFALGVNEGLDARADQSLWWAEQLLSEVRAQRGATPEAIFLLTMFYVFAEWLTQGTMGRLSVLSEQGARAIVEAVLTGTIEINKVVFPRVLKLTTRTLRPRGQAEMN